MIYSNLHTTTEGPEGTSKDFCYNPPRAKPEEVTKSTPSLDATADSAESTGKVQADPSIFLGEVDGRAYRYFPDDFDIAQAGEQDPEIDFKKEEDLSNDIRLQLRQQAYAKFLKRDARKNIEAQVGDTLDIIADLGQLIEFAIIAVSALWADKAGLAKLDEETIKNYGQRGAAVLGFVTEGDLVLRSSFEDPASMILTLLPRYSKVQQLVRDLYIEPVKRLGL